MVKTLVDYARLKSLGDEAVALQPPAIEPDFQRPDLHISFVEPEAETEPIQLQNGRIYCLNGMIIG